MNKKLNIYTDGGCLVNPNGICGGAFAVYENDIEIGSGYTFEAAREGNSNNIGEWLGLIEALEFASNNYSNADINFYLDSDLILKQMTGQYKCHKMHLSLLKKMAKKFEKKLTGKITYNWVKGHSGNVGNERADELCTFAMKNQKNS